MAAAAPTIPQVEASRMCSKLSPVRMSPRAMATGPESGAARLSDGQA